LENEEGDEERNVRLDLFKHGIDTNFITK
jgi:hypothetical protein